MVRKISAINKKCALVNMLTWIKSSDCFSMQWHTSVEATGDQTTLKYSSITKDFKQRKKIQFARSITFDLSQTKLSEPSFWQWLFWTSIIIWLESLTLESNLLDEGWKNIFFHYNICPFLRGSFLANFKNLLENWNENETLTD